MRCFAKIAVLLLVLGTLAFPLSGSRGKKIERWVPPPASAHGRLQIRPLATVGGRVPETAWGGASVVPFVNAPGDSFTLGEYTFDDSLGGPDPQGWITVDVSNPADTFFHVDDFAGLAGGYTPLEGAQSLWCGARPDTFRLCGFAALPGYGNAWNQGFESVPFVSASDVTVSFLIRYDSEPGYDRTFLQYLTSGGQWQTAATFEGQGDSVVTVVVPGDTLAGTTTIRFQFQSDGVWSDEDGLWPTDGAVIIDSLTVVDATGLLDFQDFEGEGLGAVSTLDGDWAVSGLVFGDYANLFDGTTVLQEDSVVTNTTHLWGFFDGSNDDYTCGGFPAQPVVPFTTSPGSNDMADYLNNEIWSPFIRLDEDANGMPVPSTGSVTLEFDVYSDLPLDNLVFFEWRVRSIVDGCLGEWRNDFVYYDADKQWKRVRFELFPLIDLGATQIQVALGAVDLCYAVCGLLGSGSCHSHGPLFDNVTITAREPVDVVVTNTGDAGPGSLRDAMLAANASEDRTRIRFDIPGPGPHTMTPLTPLPPISWPVAIDATTQGGYAGVPLVAISGDSAGTSAGLSLGADQSVIAGLAIHSFAGAGITVNGDNDTIRGNYIGLTAAQVPGPNTGHGIQLRGASNAVVGGSQNEDANMIAYNGGDGVFLIVVGNAGADNTIRGNSIHSNTELGIDIYPNGVNPNDPQDSDAGTNQLQNYPVLTQAFAPGNVVEGSLNSRPNSEFVIDCYASVVCDSVGFGEGERFLGSVPVTTATDGNAFFSTTVVGTLSVGEAVTATATDASGNTSEFSLCVTAEPGPPTGIDGDPIAPGRLALFQNAPNPFNPTTAIRYDVPVPGAQVQLVIYDVLGRHVRTLVDGFEKAGQKRVTWDGQARGRTVASGVYFVRMQAGGFVRTRKMVLLR